MYLLYFYRGILKIKYGKMVGGSFISDDDDYRHTMIPKEPLTVEHGKIWCVDEYYIPCAVSILNDHRDKYLSTMKERYGKDYGRLSKIDEYMVKETIKEEIKERIKEEMPPKKKTNYINETPKALAFEDFVFTEEELRYLKARIRKDIILIESKKTDSSFGKGYKDMCATEKVRWDRDLEISYEIFDKLLMMGIKEDQI